MNNNLTETFRGELSSPGCDLRAEAQLLLALEQGLSEEDFIISCDKLFKREFSKDVISTEMKEDGRRQNILWIHLSRSGLYDQLPEGLFFQSPHRSSMHSVAEMAEAYKQNTKKEEEIRKFFLPFEHDFFLQRIKLEEMETVLLEGLRSGILNDHFIRFWGLPRSIPKALVTPLIVMLPHAYKVAGNLELTAQCLHQLLNENVVLQQKYGTVENAELACPPALGETELGVNMVCGDSFCEGDFIIEIVIGPLKKSNISDYLEGGNRFVLLQTFNRFFIPAGTDSIITLKVPHEKQHMSLQKGTEPVLGYSSVL